MSRTAKQFLLVIVDDDAKTFAIEGPMTDDRALNSAICAAQESGRKVRCFSVTSERESALKWGLDHGLKILDHMQLPHDLD
jgi:hypothetical protein